MIYEFKGKFNLTFKKCQPVLIEDNDLKHEIEAFQQKFSNIVKEFNFKKGEIYNLDERGLPFEIIPRKVITKTGQSLLVLNQKVKKSKR